MKRKDKDDNPKDRENKDQKVLLKAFLGTAQLIQLDIPIAVDAL